jgi:hypothetical protein
MRLFVVSYVHMHVPFDDPKRERACITGDISRGNVRVPHTHIHAYFKSERACTIGLRAGERLSDIYIYIYIYMHSSLHVCVCIIYVCVYHLCVYV